MGMVIHKTVGFQVVQRERAIEREFKGSPRPPDVQAGVDAIQKEVSLLEKTWSQMAGRNVIADIVRLVASLEPRLKAEETRKVAVAVKQKITDIMGGYSPSKARYASVLCLGYKVTTIGDAYTGSVSDRSDLEQKVGEILTAIKNAESHVSKTYTEPSMLKVFMAPEFYFRGARGGYDADAVNGTRADGKKSLVELLQTELRNDKYKDWLFVLGTVIVVTRPLLTICNVCRKPAGFEVKDGKSRAFCKDHPKDAAHTCTEMIGPAQIENLALILKEKLVHTISKELVAGADYNPTKGETMTILTDKGAKVPVGFYAPAGNADPNPTKFTDERMGGCVFTVDGITIGCEVCLDHDASAGGDGSGRLSGDGAHGIQINLIPAGGMRISKFRTVANGVIFNVDGLTPHVQAVGLTTNKKELVLARSDKTAGGVQYDDIFIAKNWKEMTQWVATHSYGPSEAVGASIAAPNGAVLAYGPFEIPSTV